MSIISEKEKHKIGKMIKNNYSTAKTFRELQKYWYKISYYRTSRNYKLSKTIKQAKKLSLVVATPQNVRNIWIQKMQKEQNDLMIIKVMQVLIMLIFLILLILNYSLKILNLQLEINSKIYWLNREILNSCRHWF